jgi:hypothetical protein
LEVKTMAAFAINMTRILYEVSLRGKQFGTFVPSKTAGLNNLLFRNEMLRHNKAMDELEFIIMKGVSVEVMNTTIVLNNQNITVKDAITSKITATSKGKMTTKELFDGVYLTNATEQTWTLTTKTEYGQEAEDHLNVIINMAQETEKFKAEAKEIGGKEITIGTKRNKSARTFEEYNLQLERDNDNTSKTEELFVNNKYFRDRHRSRNYNKADFGISTVYEGNNMKDDRKQKYQRYSNAVTGNRGTFIEGSIKSKTSDISNNSPDGSLPSLQSTVSSLVETIMYDYMRKIELSREIDKIKARKEQQEFMKFEREEMRKQQKEFMDLIIKVLTQIAQSGLTNNNVVEATAALDTKKATASGVTGNMAQTKLDDTVEQEKLPARQKKTEPPVKRLDISTTTMQFAIVNQKRSTTPKRNNTAQQKEVTTLSEFNMMNESKEEEDKDRKMRGRRKEAGIIENKINYLTQQLVQQRKENLLNANSLPWGDIPTKKANSICMFDKNSQGKHGKTG